MVENQMLLTDTHEPVNAAKDKHCRKDSIGFVLNETIFFEHDSRSIQADNDIVDDFATFPVNKQKNFRFVA
jgi:hypothetical protein